MRGQESLRGNSRAQHAGGSATLGVHWARRAGPLCKPGALALPNPAAHLCSYTCPWQERASAPLPGTVGRLWGSSPPPQQTVCTSPRHKRRSQFWSTSRRGGAATPPSAKPSAPLRAASRHARRRPSLKCCCCRRLPPPPTPTPRCAPLGAPAILGPSASKCLIASAAACSRSRPFRKQAPHCF